MSEVEASTPSSEVTKVLNLWEYLKAVKNVLEKPLTQEIDGIEHDIRSLIELVYAQCEGAGNLAQLSKSTQLRWVEAIATGNNSVFAQYAAFLSEFSREEIESRMGNIEHGHPEAGKFLEELVRFNPLVGLTANLLYSEDNGWYKESIKSAADVSRKIDALFEHLIRRARNNKCSYYLQQFLSDFKDSQHLMVKDCVNLANCLAISARKEDCAVLCSSAEFHVPDKDMYEYYLKEAMKLEEFPVYKKHGGASTSKEKRFIAVPCYISAVDVIEFLKFFGGFW